MWIKLWIYPKNCQISRYVVQMSPHFYQEIVRPLHQRNVPSTKNFLRNEPPGVRPTVNIVEHISKEKTATLNLMSGYVKYLF